MLVKNNKETIMKFKSVAITPEILRKLVEGLR